MSLSIEQIMLTSPVVPVIVIDDISDAVPLAKTLVDAGLKVLEVTLRTECGLAAISQIKEQVPQAIIGAGTVVTSDDVKDAVSAGAEFLVSPGATPLLLDQALKSGVPILPGVATPGEAMAALEVGLQHMKFFPAEAAGGVPMLKSIAGPLPAIKFCPTGGINIDNAHQYLDLDNVLCVGGTWMLDKQAIADKEWDKIGELASQASVL